MSYTAKIRDLRGKNKDDLLKQLGEFKKELSQLRVSQQLNVGAARLGRIRTIRKGIARILTVLNKNERDNLRKFYSDKKLRAVKPKALRPKLTHRRRLALKANEKNHRTRRQLRLAQKFPRRIYAVKYRHMKRNFAKELPRVGATSHLMGLIRLHEAQIQTLREEELAANARAELLEHLADCLERGELPHEFPEKLASVLSGRLIGEDRGDTMIPSALPADTLAQDEAPSVASVEGVTNEKEQNTTASPAYNELEELFPSTFLKRPRRADPPPIPTVCPNSSGRSIITVTDILAGIPSLGHWEQPADKTGDSLADPLLRPPGRMRTLQQRKRDYYEDAAPFGGGNEDNSNGRENSESCTPSSFWNVWC